MDKSRQYFKTWHFTHEDRCLAGDRISKLLDKMKTDGGMESVSLLAELCTLQPAPARSGDDARLCHLAKIPCNFAHIGVMRIFLAPNILPSLVVDWLMYLCVPSGDSGINKEYYSSDCSLQQHSSSSRQRQQCLKPCFYGEVMIHSPFSWLTLLSLAWGPHVFIYLFI